MSMPHATQQQIDSMNKIAEEKMKKDGIVYEETHDVHPMLAVHNEQPEQDVSEPVQDNHQDDNQDSQEETQEETQDIEPVKTETNKEYNLRLLRERAERAERERDEMMRAIMAQQKPQQQEVK